ncbi:hypothetical protein HDU92_005006 [Lobulomyces angularis]|nr:hypothetical protein HDU92_005006 [Lobulomyces angularis]
MSNKLVVEIKDDVKLQTPQDRNIMRKTDFGKAEGLSGRNPTKEQLSPLKRNDFYKYEQSGGLNILRKNVSPLDITENKQFESNVNDQNEERTVIFTEYGMEILNFNYAAPVHPIRFKPNIRSPGDIPLYFPAKNKALPPQFPQTKRSGENKNIIAKTPKRIRKQAMQTMTEMIKGKEEIFTLHTLRYLKKFEQLKEPVVFQKNINISKKPKASALNSIKQVSNENIESNLRSETESVVIKLSEVNEKNKMDTLSTLIQEVNEINPSPTNSLAIQENLETEYDEDDEWLKKQKEELFETWGRNEEIVDDSNAVNKVIKEQKEEEITAELLTPVLFDTTDIFDVNKYEAPVVVQKVEAVKDAASIVLQNTEFSKTPNEVLVSAATIFENKAKIQDTTSYELAITTNKEPSESTTSFTENKIDEVKHEVTDASSVTSPSQINLIKVDVKRDSVKSSSSSKSNSPSKKIVKEFFKFKSKENLKVTNAEDKGDFAMQSSEETPMTNLISPFKEEVESTSLSASWKDRTNLKDSPVNSCGDQLTENYIKYSPSTNIDSDSRSISNSVPSLNPGFKNKLKSAFKKGSSKDSLKVQSSEEQVDGDFEHHGSLRRHDSDAISISGSVKSSKGGVKEKFKSAFKKNASRDSLREQSSEEPEDGEFEHHGGLKRHDSDAVSISASVKSSKAGAKEKFKNVFKKAASKDSLREHSSEEQVGGDFEHHGSLRRYDSDAISISGSVKSSKGGVKEKFKSAFKKNASRDSLREHSNEEQVESEFEHHFSLKRHDSDAASISASAISSKVGAKEKFKNVFKKNASRDSLMENVSEEQVGSEFEHDFTKKQDSDAVSISQSVKVSKNKFKNPFKKISSKDSPKYNSNEAVMKSTEGWNDASEMNAEVISPLNGFVNIVTKIETNAFEDNLGSESKSNPTLKVGEQQTIPEGPPQNPLPLIPTSEPEIIETVKLLPKRAPKVVASDISHDALESNKEDEVKVLLESAGEISSPTLLIESVETNHIDSNKKTEFDNNDIVTAPKTDTNEAIHSPTPTSVSRTDVLKLMSDNNLAVETNHTESVKVAKVVTPVTVKVCKPSQLSRSELMTDTTSSPSVTPVIKTAQKQQVNAVGLKSSPILLNKTFTNEASQAKIIGTSDKPRTEPPLATKLPLEEKINQQAKIEIKLNADDLKTAFSSPSNQNKEEEITEKIENESKDIEKVAVVLNQVLSVKTEVTATSNPKMDFSPQEEIKVQISANLVEAKKELNQNKAAVAATETKNDAPAKISAISAEAKAVSVINTETKAKIVAPDTKKDFTSKDDKVNIPITSNKGKETPEKNNEIKREVVAANTKKEDLIAQEKVESINIATVTKVENLPAENTEKVKTETVDDNNKEATRKDIEARNVVGGIAVKPKLKTTGKFLNALDQQPLKSEVVYENIEAVRERRDSDAVSIASTKKNGLKDKIKGSVTSISSHFKKDGESKSRDNLKSTDVLNSSNNLPTTKNKLFNSNPVLGKKENNIFKSGTLHKEAEVNGATASKNNLTDATEKRSQIALASKDNLNKALSDADNAPENSIKPDNIVGSKDYLASNKSKDNLTDPSIKQIEKVSYKATLKGLKVEVKIENFELHCIESGKGKSAKAYFPMELRRVLNCVSNKEEVEINSCIARDNGKDGSELKEITFKFESNEISKNWSNALKNMIYGGSYLEVQQKAVLVLVDKYEGQQVQKTLEKYLKPVLDTVSKKLDFKSTQFGEFSVNNLFGQLSLKGYSHVLITKEDFLPTLQQIIVRNNYHSNLNNLHLEKDPVDAAISIIKSSFGSKFEKLNISYINPKREDSGFEIKGMKGNIFKKK